MHKTISELWHGKILPQDMCRNDNAHIKELISLISRDYNSLCETLSAEQKELLRAVEANNQELSVLVEEEIFTQGFKIGTKLAAEAFYSEKAK